MKHQAYPGTQAVQRAMRLLRTFMRTDAEELRLAELAPAVGLNKTTTFRLLTALEEAEMIKRSPAGDAYRLGPALLMLGSQALGASGLRSASRETLRALADETHETATIEVLVEHEVLILDEVLGRFVVGAMPSVGTRWGAHATSTGKVLLAGLPPAELDSLLERRLDEITPKTIVDPDALKRELGRVRERGFATNIEELEEGSCAVGTPVRSAEGVVVAAVSLCGPRSRFHPARITELAALLAGAGDRISERLGWQKKRIRKG